MSEQTAISGRSGPWQTPHTPGPWVSRDVADPEDSDCGQWVVEMPGNPYTRRLYFGSMEDIDGEDIANANLVAAAPDLLEAAERMVSAWDSGVLEEEDAALADLEDAIAKAKGETP